MRLLKRMVALDVARDGAPALTDDETEFAARMLIAASDGLQLQWLLDPSIDMEADLQRMALLLRRNSARS